MSTQFRRLLWLLLLLPTFLCSQVTPPKPAFDQLNRANPRAAATAFLQACEHSNYSLAAEYLDLRQLPERERASAGQDLAKQLEAILNSDSHFDVLRLSLSPEGNPSDNPDPSREVVASVPRYAGSFNLEMERVELQAGLPIWLFSRSTVAAIPSLTPKNTTAAIESRVPRFLVLLRVLDTPIWKWLALLIVAAIMALVFRLTERTTVLVFNKIRAVSGFVASRSWIQPLLQPWLVLLSAVVFGLAEQLIDPSALSRLYIGRFLLLIVVWAFAWCFINVVELFLSRVDSLLDPRQRIVSHSLIYMGKRGAKVAIMAVAIIIVLDNWGYNMTTMIAGLGVGGIAVALAAQATIANVFGGVSVIADHPVMVGDFGNFGGVLGTVEDIGLRSTRVRTLSRTIMSIPNSSFAGMNLENYAQRDKILFNPTLQIKRGTPKEKIETLILEIESLLRSRPNLQVGPAPVRLTSLTATTMALEIFAYALTADIDDFYKIEAGLFLDLDKTLLSLQVELG